MRTTTLDPMTESEFGQFMTLILSAYIAERATSDRMSQGEAECFARDQHARLLPNGQLTEGHHFLRISATHSREWLGGLWVQINVAARSAFLYNITVFPQYRRQGFARDALRLLQDRVRSLGCATLALNVFATNAAAMSLYNSLGFSAVSSHMNKAL